MTEWTKKDGTKIDVKDMDDDHLSNTIAMLERGLKTRKAWISELKREQARRSSSVEKRREQRLQKELNEQYKEFIEKQRKQLDVKPEAQPNRLRAEVERRLRKSRDPEPSSRFAELDLDLDKDT